MPSKPMFATPERSDQIPPSPAKPIGTAKPTAAPNVPVLDKSPVSANVRANESVVTPIKRKKSMRTNFACGRVIRAITYSLLN